MPVICRDITLDEARLLPPIPSSFVTDTVFRLTESTEAAIHWTLTEVALSLPFSKQYDSGSVDEWLEPYLEECPLASVRFIVAEDNDLPLGLLAWRRQDWNETLWLMDIRTRPQARRVGIGSALVSQLKLRARTSDCRGIFVETQINNYPAVSFYRKLDFHITGFNHHLYTDEDLTHQDVALFLYWKSVRSRSLVTQRNFH